MLARSQPPHLLHRDATAHTFSLTLATARLRVRFCSSAHITEACHFSATDTRALEHARGDDRAALLNVFHGSSD
jgi:hypothetical protein